MNERKQISKLNNEGYLIISEVYSENERNRICELLMNKEFEGSSILKSKNLFAIRRLLWEVPELTNLIFNDKLKSIISEFQTDEEYFLSKAIYFDKPKDSNWFVAYHQDLTINVSERIEMEGFANWTNKRGQIGVQPPTEYLNRTITVRVHLDDANDTNGALRVIPESHKEGIVRTEALTKDHREVVCEVKQGGIMLMKPLTFHASSRSFGKSKRRVIHLELCDKKLPPQMKWKEKQKIEL